MAVVVTTGAIRCAMLQSNRLHQQTTTQLFTGLMSFLSPIQQHQSTEWEKYYIPRTCSSHSPGGLPVLSLTTNGSWLPWGGLPSLSSALLTTEHLKPYSSICL